MSHAAQPHFKSQLILPTSNSNFELYFSGPILAIYMMKPLQILTHQISTNLNHFEFQSTKNILCLMIRVNKVFDTTPNLNYSQSLQISINLNHFKCLFLSQFSTNFGHILNSTSPDHHPHLPKNL